MLGVRVNRYRMGEDMTRKKKTRATRDGAANYRGFREHPRYGQAPRITGLNPVEVRPIAPGMPIINFIEHSGQRIPNTAIQADAAKQKLVGPFGAVSHYFDLHCVCSNCELDFLFFAEEQKHWYEDLGLSLDKQCEYCVVCRHRYQTLKQKHRRYEELCRVSTLSEDEAFEMADCCLSLIEATMFLNPPTERVRMLLNRLPERRCRKLRKHLRAAEELA